MSIIRWDPYRSLLGMKQEFDKIFSNWDDEAPTHTSHWRPAVDIVEDEDTLRLNVEVPGMAKEDIKINVENGILSISGERKFDKDVKEENCHRIERSYGGFYRSFSLPTKVDTEKIEAHYENGILKISMTKKEEAKPRQIEVKVH
jgi:HSP20 family protein